MGPRGEAGFLHEVGAPGIDVPLCVGGSHVEDLKGCFLGSLEPQTWKHLINPSLEGGNEVWVT